jgi:hypothetical protein
LAALLTFVYINHQFSGMLNFDVLKGAFTPSLRGELVKICFR